MRSARMTIAVGTVLLGTGVLFGSPACARNAGGPPGWEQQADQALGGGRGLGRQLMTEQEWQAHHHEMQTLRGAEREKAEREWHERMRERAQERGLTLPETPGPHHGGPGGGRQGAPPPRN